VNSLLYSPRAIEALPKQHIVGDEFMARKKYIVLTWDTDEQAFTPQNGVDPGPHTLVGTKKALCQLRQLGYGYDGWEDDLAESDPFVLVREAVGEVTSLRHRL
jgi:hypothetical protein